MATVKVTLPDGSSRDVAQGTPALEVVRAIGTRLADAAVVVSLNGTLAEVSRPLNEDCSLRVLTSRDPETLEVYRHSTAHLLAMAVQELYPETKLGIGPPTEEGFFYDFERPTRFTPEDLPKIEKKMQEIAERDLPYERVLIPKSEGLKKFAAMGESMKCELIDEKSGDPMQCYTIGPAADPKWIDFCRGPHVPSSGRIKHVKRRDIAGA